MTLGNNIQARVSRIKSRIPFGKGKGKSLRGQQLTFGQGPLRNAALGKVQNIKGTIQGIGGRKSKKRVKSQKIGNLGILETERPARDTVRVLQLIT